MARTRQLSDLITDVRVRCDLVGSSFPADSDITELLNQGWAELYDLLIESGEKYYLTVTGSTTLTSDLLSLPADFYALAGVDALGGGGVWIAAHRFSFEQRNDYSAVAGVGWQWPNDVRFDIWGSNVKFVPAPASGQSVRLLYYPAPIRLVNGTDVIDGVSGWERYAVDWAAHQVALRDDNYDLADRIAGDLANLKARIVGLATRRNSAEAPKARVVRGRMQPSGMRRWWGW